MKLFFTLIMSILLIVGCSKEQVEHNAFETTYYKYPYGAVEEALTVSSFDVSVPDTLPIPVAFVIYDHFELNGHEYLDLSFYTNDNDLLTISVTTDQSLGCPNEVVTDTKEDAVCFQELSYVTHVSKTEGALRYQIEYRHHTSELEEAPTKDQLLSLLDSLTLS
ncbi:hypothetical protein GCM10012290_15990 [Halolactibacillus alkaliphilus]|uniref:Lipoprotein n=1 Tax=Halolactibacillus alkaliphilus TaxID=442899 RepID=A0A511X1T3_9BACI|nr:hypothetical protein [Halolactibacillus alkaliphilus]GEN56887.1 hypothetical protein HAL01_13510 [Halolactibacillus alkaliphilus]GGN71280.1 hypothetical protein GCM10012290_15990 [Halolactibacillus alkaliphilus]SFO82712.1 hypothetical protein SAMN05720591_11455 [Halolactibacillus alkaliphilus]